MDFTNDIPTEIEPTTTNSTSKSKSSHNHEIPVFRDDKSPQLVTQASQEHTDVSYDDHVTRSKSRSCWSRSAKTEFTPRCIALTDLVLHILSIIFAAPTIVLYTCDLAYSSDPQFSKKTNTYHPSPRPLPARIVVLDALCITFAACALIWSSIYLAVFAKRARHQQLNRKWTTFLDLLLFSCIAGVSDSTFGVRTSDKACRSAEAWGACLPWRQGIMIAGGVMGIMLSVVIHIRFGVTLDIRGRRKKAEKRRREMERKEEERRKRVDLEQSWDWIGKEGNVEGLLDDGSDPEDRGQKGKKGWSWWRCRSGTQVEGGSKGLVGSQAEEIRYAPRHGGLNYGAAQ